MSDDSKITMTRGQQQPQTTTGGYRFSPFPPVFSKWDVLHAIPCRGGGLCRHRRLLLPPSICPTASAPCKDGQ
uniref:Uncharacterized protein n=1 Tax=Steinernema glaseri TaxID=37863 RepID=A0A1I7Z2A9_9BILA